jgi:crotonobetainyl-CoA:carnitine CoA-transferase CaiB-like acyl-CoA transferase
MALLSRQSTGKGRWVDVSMTDGAMSMLSIHAATVLAGMPSPERGNMMLTGMFPCYETYRCACGGYVSVGPLEPWFWENFLEAIGRMDMAGLQYATGEEGGRAKAELSKVFASRTRDEWVALFQEKDVCVSPVFSLEEALSHPQVRARDMVVRVESPFGERERQLGRPLKFRTAGESAEGMTEMPPRRPPRLGEHDGEILRGIGYRNGQIADLRRKGVIRRR